MNTADFAFSEEIQEFIAEREAIAEIDGELTGEQARELAYACYVWRFRLAYARYYPMSLSTSAG